MCLLAAAACDANKDAPSGDEQPTPADSSAAKKEGADEGPPARRGRDRRDKKERGSGSVMIGDSKWDAERCKARIKGERLSVSCSHTDVSDEKVKRQEVKLVINDYKGPGTYKAANIGSMFVGVGIDVAEAKAAEKDDAKTATLATDAIKGAGTVLLIGADIEVTAADDAFVDGTFSWSGGPNSKKPAFTGRTTQ